MGRLFAGVKWECVACGQAMGTCDCWVRCECGSVRLKGTECQNDVWHVAKKFAEEAADKIVEDMAGSYKLFRRDHMAARLKRAVVRQTLPILIETFEGVEAAKKEQANAGSVR